MKKAFVVLLVLALLCAVLLCAACAKDPNAAFVGSWEVPGYKYVCCFEEDGTVTITDTDGTVQASGFYSAEGKEITVDMGGGYVSTGILGNDIITFTEEGLTTEYRRVPADTASPEESPQSADNPAPEDSPQPADSPAPLDSPAPEDTLASSEPSPATPTEGGQA